MRSLFIGLVVAAMAVPALAAEEAHSPPAREWSFEGIFGAYDRAAAQRGFLVYDQVCAACHALQYVHYRSLQEIGFSEDQVREIAAARFITDGPDETGEMFQRPGRPSDAFFQPFANEEAARFANGGAAPPNLSTIVKARHGGADYLYALLTGYEDPPADLTMQAGMNYNSYFAGGQIAMAPPLFEGMVDYADGTQATVEQMASDVSTFLTWASHPELEARKSMGLKVILFLLVLSALVYATKRKVWRQIH
ncbi:MAG: cytochrome c1 [Alphaproteobacteria bacterium]